MDEIRIRGGKRLSGKIRISGAKNAALPLMAASLLTDEPLVLVNLPQLADISTMAHLLTHLGVYIRMAGETGNGGHTGRSLSLQAGEITDTTAPYDLVRRMRASIVVLGPLLARNGHARVSLPGGCAIGTRPVDLHIKGLSQLGAEIDLTGGYIDAKAPDGLIGANFVFPAVSVGATENVLMAACLAKGESVLSNVAREPEITDLAHCLVAMGAEISGIGSDTLIVQGVEHLHGTEHTVIADRIEAGTYAMAAAMTGGDIELIGVQPDLMESVLDKLIEAGVKIEPTDQGLRVRCDTRLQGVDVMTEPFPGFPTDLQAQISAMLCLADGNSIVTEKIFPDRFLHVAELNRMGARLRKEGPIVIIEGVKKLIGAPVMASDLRASAALVLAGLIAKGQTQLYRVYHIDRGYEQIEKKLHNIGADITRLSE